MVRKQVSFIKNNKLLIQVRESTCSKKKMESNLSSTTFSDPTKMSDLFIGYNFFFFFTLNI